MKPSFLIKRELIERATECEDALAVGALLESLREDDSFFPYLMMTEQVLGAYLFGEDPSRSQRTRIKNGLEYLQEIKYIQLEYCDRFLLEIRFVELSDEQKNDENHMLLYAEDLLNVFRADTKMNKFSLYKTFCMIVNNMDNPTDTKEYQNKFCRLPSYYMALKLNMSPKTLVRYIDELERLKIIYIRHTDGRYNPVIRMRETNIYCRFSDKKLCNEYTTSLGYPQEPIYICDVNFKRRMKQIYNQICKGKIDYPEKTYDELIMYINDAETAIGYDIDIVYEAQQKALKKCN